jgi:predicted ATPase
MIGGVARRVSSPVLVGRAAEVARLNAALERAATGRPAILVVAGEAGVGKTRLVLELGSPDGGRPAEALLAPTRLFELRGGVALILTYRSDELHRRHPLRPFLAEARTLAEGLGARRLTAEIDALARRARIVVAPLADGDAPDGDAPAPAAAVAHRLRLAG